METILITGGSGLIGQALIPLLVEKGYSVNVLSRSNKKIKNVRVFLWDIDQNEIDKEAFKGVDHIIHLAGLNVAEKRWTKSRKATMYNSRVKGAELLLNQIGELRIKSFISASGISIYGTKTSNHIFTEEDTLNIHIEDFLAQLTVDWEKAAINFQSKVERLVILRTPIVLSANGGALKKMSKVIKSGFGSALGSGQQWMPWIHINDLCKAYLKGIEDENFSGIYNVVAPEHVTNSAFTKAIATSFQKKIWAPKVPAFLLKLLFGEMSKIVLNGSRLSGEKLSNHNFTYEFQNIDEALENLRN